LLNQEQPGGYIEVPDRMKEGAIQSFRARKEGLLVHALEDEVLVYDLVRHKAHCLNQASATVWKHCDGRNAARDLARIVGRELDIRFDEQMVWLALLQLDKARLLENRILPASGPARISRRDVIKRAGLAAAISVPLISSIVSPTPAQAATCVAKGGNCTSSLQCCSKVCNTGTHKCL
jgi:hypothetical protein